MRPDVMLELFPQWKTAQEWEKFAGSLCGEDSDPFLTDWAV